MAWTDERIALLTKLWQEGRSASQIAEALGEGLTRNAVIGKAHRLGLSARPSPLKPAADAVSAGAVQGPGAEIAPRTTPAGSAEEAVVPPPAKGGQAASALASGAPTGTAPAAQPARRSARTAAKPARVTLLDLTDRICKWPIGHPDEPDFHFCGKPINPGFPYCPDHCLVAYQSQLQRKDRPAGPPPPFRPNLPRPR